MFFEASSSHFGTGNVAPARKAHFLSSHAWGSRSMLKHGQKDPTQSTRATARSKICVYQRPLLATSDIKTLRIKHEHDAKPSWLAAQPCAQCMLPNKFRSAANKLSAATRTRTELRGVGASRSIEIIEFRQHTDQSANRIRSNHETQLSCA